MKRIVQLVGNGDNASLFFKNMEEYAHCLTGSPFVFKIFREIEPNATSTSVG